MSENTNNGGPAFPQKEPLMNDWEGMTLRDYFAAHANDADVETMMFRMGYVDKVVDVGAKKEIRKGLPYEARQIARYMHADAMLKARSA